MNNIKSNYYASNQCSKLMGIPEVTTCIKILFFVCIFSMAFYLFYNQAINYKGLFPSDLPEHLSFVDKMVSGAIKAPEVGFEYTVYAISKIFFISYEYAAIILMSVIYTGMVFIIGWMLKNFLMISELKVIIFSACLISVSAIYLPFFSQHLLVGPGGPNVWHNPTVLMIKPLALLIVYFTLKGLQEEKSFYWLCSSALLFISLIYKPSFGIVFMPALGIYVLINYPKNFKSYKNVLIMVFPSILLLTYQTFMLLNHGDLNNKDPVYISSFAVLRHYTPNVFVSFLQGLAFPLALLICHFKKTISDRYLQLSWLVLIIAYAEFALLVEGAPDRVIHGNFGWGYLVSMQLVFVFSFIELYRWTREVYSINSTFIEKLKIQLVWLIFSFHLFSGLIYLTRIFSGGSYY